MSISPPVETRKRRSLLRLLVISLFACALGVGIVFAIDAWNTTVVYQNISGTVTRGEEPLVWDHDGGLLLVIFVPEDRSGGNDPVRAEVNRETGEFKLKELNAGWYRVAVHQFDEHHQDALRNQFDPGNSPIRVKVSQSDQVIPVDIPKVIPRAKKK